MHVGLNNYDPCRIPFFNLQRSITYLIIFKLFSISKYLLNMCELRNIASKNTVPVLKGLIGEMV